MSTGASGLRGLSMALVVATAAIAGCSKGASSDAPGAVSDEVALTPPSPPAGPVPIPYPNVAAPAEPSPAPVAAPEPSPATVAPAPKPKDKGTGQATGKRQYAPIQ